MAKTGGKKLTLPCPVRCSRETTARSFVKGLETNLSNPRVQDIALRCPAGVQDHALGQGRPPPAGLEPEGGVHAPLAHALVLAGTGYAALAVLFSFL